MQKVTTFLWYDTEAEEAMNYYVSVLPNSKVLNIRRWGEGGPVAAGLLMVGTFQLAGQEFMCMNAGPHHKFNDAISLMVNCESQQEVDDLWAKLSAGGEESMCGWLKDRWGLSWQITPIVLTELMSDPDPEKAGRVMQAMLQMRKIDIATLQRAYNGE
jgi:predicted 3-demethylubiquinone-9 3-methyltransferase (glyoxalase superfamily)